MSVQKFKTFQEAEEALWNFEPDAAYYKKLAEFYKFARRLNPIEYPRGVFKFKTMEEANAHREQIEVEWAQKQRANRKRVEA